MRMENPDVSSGIELVVFSLVVSVDDGGVVVVVVVVDEVDEVDVMVVVVVGPA